jgi:hypothetical protein
MTARRLWLLPLLIAMTAMLAGCGQGGANQAPALSKLPLVGGAQIVSRARECDPGANAFCALEFVLVDPHSPTSTALLASEQRSLRLRGWTSANGDFGQESAANSPGHKLRLTYGTAASELEGIDLGWIQRSDTIARSLSDAMFDRASALSVMLETGSS